MTTPPGIRSNPDPTKRVKYGLQSFEEMFMGFMNVAEVHSSVDDLQKQAHAGESEKGLLP
jgi:hypothetical protein